jgi:hypothetical protein
MIYLKPKNKRLVNTEKKILDPKNRFNIMMNFKGFGNPKGNRKICFVGIEEASGFCCIPTKDLDKYVLANYENETQKAQEQDYYEYRKWWNIINKPSRYTKIYEYMAKIINSIKFDLKEEEILNKYLLTENGFAFHMNLYPIGRKNTSEINHDFTNIDRFSLTSFSQYEALVREKRFLDLFNFWKKHNNNFALTICFGSTYWEDFKTMFKINELKAVYDKEYMRYYNGNNILLTPFLKSGNGGFNNDIFHDFKDFIKEYNISL